MSLEIRLHNPESSPELREEEVKPLLLSDRLRVTILTEIWDLGSSFLL